MSDISGTWPQPPNYFLVKEPQSVEQRSIALCPPSATPESVSIASAPSGTIELQLSNLDVVRNLGTFTVSLGVPGRVYTVVANTLGDDGNTYEATMYLPMDTTLATDPPLTPQSQNFGTPITWGNGIVPSQLTPIVVDPTTYVGAPSATVGITSGVLVAPGVYTKVLNIQTLPGSTNNVWLRPDGSAAAPNTGILVFAGGGSVSFGGPAYPLPTAPITAITDGSSPQVVLLSGS